MTAAHPKDALCVCGHTNYYHPKSKNKKRETFPCTWCNDKWQFCKCKDFNLAQLNEKGEPLMDGDKAAKVKKVKKAKKEKVAKVKKVKKEKIVHAIQYEATAKESKELSDAKNDSQLAYIYRTVKANGPATFDKLWADMYRFFQSSKAPLEKQKINVRTYLSRLDKAGLVKRSKVAA